MIPPEKQKTSAASQPVDWSLLFKAAGLDPAQCTPVEPESLPPDYADTRAAWTAALPDRPDVPIRIEAAAWHGKPVSWRLIVPSWENLAIDTASSPREVPLWAGIVLITIAVVIFAGSAFFARRNLRIGRGDRRGAVASLFSCGLHWNQLDIW